MAAVSFVRVRLSKVPTLVTLYSHRYLPADVSDTGYPVFSVYQTDTIYYGCDILDYLEREFAGRRAEPLRRVDQRIPFWSALAEGKLDEL